MTDITLGGNLKKIDHPTEREQLRTFYRDIFGCKVTEKAERVDLIKLENSFYIGVGYDKSAVCKSDRMNSIWLELPIEHPKELKHKILKFGIKELKYWDMEHFYLQASGGQIFRLLGKNRRYVKVAAVCRNRITTQSN